MKSVNREYRERLGSAIRQRRRALKMTQAQLSEAAGINRSHLSLIESGEHCPTARTVEQLARALDTTPEALNWTGEYLAAVNDFAEERLYPGLAELLNDPREVMRYNITEEEKRVLRTLRLQWQSPSKQFFIEALIDYRMSKPGTENREP